MGEKSVYMRQQSDGSSVRRARNAAVQVAASRLARAMALHGEDEDGDGEEEKGGVRERARFVSPPPGGRRGGLSWRSAGNRNQSDESDHSSTEENLTIRSLSAGKFKSVNQTTLVHPRRISRGDSTSLPSIQPSTDKRREKRFPANLRHQNSTETSNLREASALQDESDHSSTEENLTIRLASAGKFKSVNQTTLVHPRRISRGESSPLPSLQPSTDKRRDRRFPANLMHQNSTETSNMREASALQDELDMLQEENDNFYEKLRLAEERCRQTAIRAQVLENQIAALGEGLSTEDQQLSTKEEILREKEVVLKAATQAMEVMDEERSHLRQEAEAARDEAAAVGEKLREVECEAKPLRALTRRMILTQEEMA